MDWQGRVTLRDTFDPAYRQGAALFERGEPIEKCRSPLSRAGWEEARKHKTMVNAFTQRSPAPHA